MEEKAVLNPTTARHPLRLLAAGLALGVAFDVLFNGKAPGISVVLMAVLLLAGLALTAGWEKARALGANLWLPAALLFFAAMCAVRANSFLLFLNLCACLMLLALMTVYLAQRSMWALSLVDLVAAPLQALGWSIYRGGQATAQVTRHDLAPGARHARRHVGAVLRGLLLAVPVLLLFGALLASADLIFADRLERLFGPDFFHELGRWIGHILLALGAGYVMAGGLIYTLRKREADWSERLAGAELPRFVGITETIVVLTAVNVLFFLFVLVQIPYLFGGQANIVPQGFTYAEYARRGFGELVAVAVLTLGMAVLLGMVTRREGRCQRVAFGLSASVLVGLTCVMLVSAFKRLLMYEVAYGFTEMRIYPHVFMVWLGILLAWFVLTLWLWPKRFAIGVLLAALGFIATLNLINPEALAVRENVGRSLGMQIPDAQSTEPTPEIDVYYLTGLTDDAVPALVAAAGQLTGEARAIVDKNLIDRRTDKDKNVGWRAWQSYNVGRWRAYRALRDR